MKIFGLNKAILLTSSLLSLLTSQAFSQNNFTGNGRASLEIKAVSMPGKSGLVSCHNSLLAECFITLSIMAQSEGFIIIKNTSTNPAFNIRALLPADWTNVSQPSICEVLNPGEECSVILKATGAEPPRPRTTMELKGTNTNSAFFDLEVVA
ncbi:hypothetical protein SDA22_10250 [Legionella pneumophila serogroup 1]|uniref:hypothetical protein n=1 Tax=Legionella pneumophila TaxID=446 RepID=UPI0007709F39|nr:hypothetical protein [Legionella pneumophila]HAT8851655.1 hypothetical protein [Legionella pneumophila subsp. pneumophila]PYB44296.1 hypothetical protein DM454_08960 [Legionella pneumophila]PYB51497.1 hypothetical protein DM456_08010 [Legionella pneumophila]PYB62858.1 hypothetical protein DM455_09485 [Legionella pneumophila]QIB25612.1 hypothetical protein GCO85_14885 [Legionella pneumophila]